MRRRFAFVLWMIALAFGCSGSWAQRLYFPEGTLGETARDHQVVVDWYSEHLSAMSEPSLWELSKDKTAHIYRFLWLRTFDHPISVRVEICEDGSSTVVTKVLSGQGGYEPGHLKLVERRKLARKDIEHLLSRLGELEFWQLSSIEVDPNFIHLDGARWILEGVRAGKYHVVDRWSPETAKGRALGLTFLLDLAKLKLLYQDVY